MAVQRYDEFGGVPVDPLTSLYRLGAGGPNLTTALAAAAATGRRVALLHIDVDDFGAINRNMGELVGEQALSAIAQRLHKAMPAGGWLWRIGGDQFLAGIGYRHDEPDAVALAERLRDAFETPLSLPPYTLPVSLSIGVAIYPDHAHDAAALLAAAEQALRRARREARSGVDLFSAEEAAAESGETISRTLRVAMERGEFQLFYQPTVNGHDGSIEGMNALLRWQNRDHGLVRPNRFLELVERA
ncbi:MAG TPA: diguanylate cyclase, partial [Xanthomonadaceae bacterium]|nr:diguanylate cyclase [Xanthomonadaceae bacterium]